MSPPATRVISARANATIQNIFDLAQAAPQDTMTSMHASKVSRPFSDQLSTRHAAAPADAGKLRTKAAPDGEVVPSPRSALAASIFATRALFCSSTLFLVALAYAVWHNVWDVVIGTAATATTSLLNHWFMSQHAFFKALDTVVHCPPRV
jgi:hypothetical protein